MKKIYTYEFEEYDIAWEENGVKYRSVSVRNDEDKYPEVGDVITLKDEREPVNFYKVVKVTDDYVHIRPCEVKKITKFK